MKQLLLSLCIPFLLLAQEDIPNTIKVRATSTIFVPADMVKLSITISSENEVPRAAFDEHKRLEDKLMSLITKYQLTDSAISYSLLSFRPGYKKPVTYQTSQEVMIQLKSLDDYEAFQLDLLENGFKSFSASFITERLDIQKELGYEAALKLAKYDAGLIAKAMGKELGDLISISVSTTDFPYIDPQRSMTAITAVLNEKHLTEIKQTIRVQTYIDARFEIDN